MTSVALGFLLVWCVALSWWDFRRRRLPNRLTGAGALVVLGYALGSGRLAAAVAGAVLLAGPYLVVHVLRPAAFGAGDVKLAVPLGAACALAGGRAWCAAAVGAPLLTIGMGLILLATHRQGRADTRLAAWIRGPTSGKACVLPHGPAMCTATVAAVLLL